MTDTNASVIVGAAVAITVVLLTQGLIALKELVAKKQNDKRESSYLAIVVVSNLDRFANGCLSVAYDDGTAYGQPAGEDGRLEVTVTPPEFQPLDIKVEWKALPRDLTYQILQIPDKREQIQNVLAGIIEYGDPYDENEYFWPRRRHYAELGLYVSKVATKLREHAGLPLEVNPAGWDREIKMMEVIDQIDEKTAEHEAQNRVSLS
jgi:hypothetical protein